MQQKVHHLMMGGMTDKAMRSHYRKSRSLAGREYEEAVSLVERIKKHVTTFDKDHGLSLDLNKIAYLANVHDRMLDRLCGTYEIKNVLLNAARSARVNRLSAF